MNWRTEANVCPGLFYCTPAQDGFLIRIRTPGGLLNHQQGQAIAVIAGQWGSEAIQITNRANLQLRSVPTAPTAEVFQTLQTLGLAAQNPSLDHLRNVMTSPTTGIDPQELIDTHPLVQALDDYIQSHPELAGLPAKFSIGIDGGGAVGIGTRSAFSWEHRYNEIQLSAVLVERHLVESHREYSSDLRAGVYFRLALGMDKQLCDTKVFIQPDECVPVVAALARVYRDYVNQTAQAQKKPRMKHLLQDWGVERYLQQVNRHLPHPLRRVTNGSMPPPTRRYGHLGVHPQRQIGLSYIGISLRLGQLTATQLRRLVQLSESFGSSHLRLTPWQAVILPDIPNERIPDVLQNLSSLGLFGSDNWVDTAIVSCAGKPGCAAAATQTQTHAIALADYLSQRLTFDEPINIHLTGCAKFCAQPSPAEITLLGTAIAQPGEIVEGYHLYTGDAQQSLKYRLCTITADEVSTVIEQVLRLYQQHREPSSEQFGNFVERYLIPNLKSWLTALNLKNSTFEIA